MLAGSLFFAIHFIGHVYLQTAQNNKKDHISNGLKQMVSKLLLPFAICRSKRKHSTYLSSHFLSSFSYLFHVAQGMLQIGLSYNSANDSFSVHMNFDLLWKRCLIS